MKSKRILVVPDTQIKPGVDLSYMTAIGRYIADKQPDVVVHIGDAIDFPSLSSYDKGKKSFEGRRLKADLEAGHEGMTRLVQPMRELQERQRANKKKVYSPRLVITLGNHDVRGDRLANDMPEFFGLIGSDAINYEQYGFEVFPFLKPVEIDGIFFVHYLSNPFTGKPYGGTALSQLKTVGRSFVVGHKQTLDIAMRPTLDGKTQFGIIAGAAYDFHEEYKGEHNNHFRGVVMLHEVNDGNALPMPVSLEYLKSKYL